MLIRTKAVMGRPTFRGIDLGAVSGDDLRVFELVNPLDDGRRGQADAAAELGIARPGVFLEFFQIFCGQFRRS